MKLTLPAFLFALALITGCRQTAPPPPSGPPPATKQSSSIGEFHRENAPAFTKEQRRLIASARKQLATDQGVKDAFHRVRPTDEGHEVFVLFVTGYEDDQPVFTPCQHAAVHFGKDGAVTKVLRGPACWP